ncbi:aminopeptidase [mine drainage metagenome]|uniref:Aminopeptidase n=1 Tax=mine drainage metagenome TaxID=410659 RepID=T0Z388_9ZZZZ
MEAQPDHEPERVIFIRSDQYNFVKIGAPSLMLSVGYRKGSREEEISKAWFRERYHAPADDLDQPVDRESAARFTDLLGRLMIRVANDPRRPTWNADSFFRTFAK